jgi:hypothetical protein
MEDDMEVCGGGRDRCNRKELDQVWRRECSKKYGWMNLQWLR